MNKWFHIPLSHGVYLRFEVAFSTLWGSGGKNPDGSLKIYRSAKEFSFAIGWSIGKVDYSTLWDVF